MPGPSERPEIQQARPAAQARSFSADDVEYVSGSSIRAEETTPRKSKSTKQMVDFKGFPLSTEEGNPLSTDKQVYPKYEYSADQAPSVVLNSENYLKEGRSTQNKFSKKNPAALPIEEQFQDTSEVARSLLGINRETTQQGLFGNVSTYGLDEKDWRVTGTSERRPVFWYRRPSSSGNYFMTRFVEDTVNSALAINSMPSPFTPPGKPDLQSQLISPGEDVITGWGQYLNSVVALYLMKYMVEEFTPAQRTEYNLDFLLSKYPLKIATDGTISFDELYWDKIWLDIEQNRFGAEENYPLLPVGTAYNFIEPADGAPTLVLPIGNGVGAADLWAEPGQEANVLISEAAAALPASINVQWDRFFFNTRVYYPQGDGDNYGHYRLQTNPSREIWEEYFGLNWDYVRTDLKNWKFTVHKDASTVTQVERDLKLPYFVLSSNTKADSNNIFSTTWPQALIASTTRLPTSGNRVGGTPGVRSQISISSVRSFRYQPGRISGFTYGSKASEIGAGPGTTIEWGVENDTDGYFFRLADGADFQIIRRSIIPLDETQFLEDAGYLGDATKVVTRNGYRQYETIIEQKNMNGDPLNGEGESGYILDPDTVTMYKIEFGWYGAIGARFYGYIPQENGECRWVTLHTLVIENQLGAPCLGDPFFFFKYRLIIGDSSKIRVNQFLYKFGASYYIDGYDKGTLYSSAAKSKVRLLNDPKFSSVAPIKNYLNAIDYTTLIGVKPKQYLYNRFGEEVYNKKEIFPKSISVFSQEDAEIKIIRQEACPEFAYTHQEGYKWELLPEKRRVKGLFTVKNWEDGDDPGLGISKDDAATYSATMAQTGVIDGEWRSPAQYLISSGESIWRASLNISDGSDANTDSKNIVRLAGDQLYQLTYGETDPGSNKFKLLRIEDKGERMLTTSVKPVLDRTQVYLPFTYAPRGSYVNGYEVEFDYFRRDQTLISDIDIISSEFYLFWTGGNTNGIDSDHGGTMRVGFAWPKNDLGILDQSRKADGRWGIQTYADGDVYDTTRGTSNGVEYINYDEEKFYEGLPVDFANDFPDNCLWVETNTHLYVDTKSVEQSHHGYHNDLWDFESADLSVPGAEGGECHGLGFKAGREIREGIIAKYDIEDSEGIPKSGWYIRSTDNSPWPNLGSGSFNITVVKDGASKNFLVPTSVSVSSDGGETEYLLYIGSAEGEVDPPSPLNEGDLVDVVYSVTYIASIDTKNQIRAVFVSKVASADFNFARMFVQAKQGARMGGMWIGQKTAQGIVLDPFTPNGSVVNLRDGGQTETSGQNLDTNTPSDGALKVITTITQADEYGLSTAPTESVDGLGVTNSLKSSDSDSGLNLTFAPNRAKCGSFLSQRGTDPAGILTPSDYPIRYLTNKDSALPLGTFYISKNESVEISLEGIFNVNAESIINSANANLATIFIARSLNTHDPADSKKEIYLTLNYDEQ